MILNCSIIDDDQCFIDDLKSIIEEFNSLNNSITINIKHTFTSPLDAINVLKNEEINLLFVDYEMPTYNGVEVVEKIGKEIPVIFVSSYVDKSIDIINKINIAGFVPKPPTRQKIEQIIQKISSNIRVPKDIITLNNSNKTQYFHFQTDEIYYIKADEKYKVIFGEDSKKQIGHFEATFREIEARLPDGQFIKINKSILVNKKLIRQSTKNKIVLTNGEEFELGQGKTIKDKFLKFFRSNQI